MKQFRTRQHGFTLMELVVTVSIIATISAVMIAPGNVDTTRLRISAATELLASDIELAQTMTISFPADPVVVRFDPSNATYWLAYASDPNTPILMAGSGDPNLTTFGVGRAVGAEGVSLGLADISGNTLTFNALGGLANIATNPVITLSIGSKWTTLTITPTTGRIIDTMGSS